MLSSPTPPQGSKTLAANAMRKAGLLDRDAQMRDLTDKPGGRKGSSKIRSHRPRPMDAIKVKPAASSSKTMLLAQRLGLSTSQAGPSSDGMAIRGASRSSTGRPRRNAVSGSSSAATPPPPLEAWKEFVDKRWNPETRLLDLSYKGGDEVHKGHRLNMPGWLNSSRDGTRNAAVILKLAGLLKPEVLSLDLSNNKLNGRHLQHIGRYLPKLVNLCVNNNEVRRGQLDYLSGSKKDKLPYIRELILTGNPVREEAISNGKGDVYKRDCQSRFPSLVMLDGEAVAQISFDMPQAPSSVPVPAPTATTFPVEMAPSFIEGVDPSLVSGFLARFFSLFDTQRLALADAYHPSSTFSYSCNTTIPERARRQGLHHKLPNQKTLQWGSWIAGSRNLSRLSNSLDKQVERLHIGGEAIVRAISGMSATKHDLAGPAEMWSMDCFPVPHGGQMALLATVHGQFTELPMEGVRSFDRTFVLIPAPEGSRARMSGWDVMILSDEWVIRAYSEHKAWAPGPMLVQAVKTPPLGAPPPIAQAQAPQLPFSLPPPQQTALLSMAEPQKSMVVQVIGRTGLNVQFSWDCLAQNEWNVERAIANFNQVKDTLDRAAYL